MSQPSAAALARAAQIWCEPQHSHKEMDVAFGLSIALALDAARAEARREVWEAFGRFITKHDEVMKASQYVWEIAQLHVGPYAGPNYKEELDALRDLRAEAAGGTT